jgi:PAS domain S-box-containing protein
VSRDRRSREELVREADKARLLLDAARHLGETLEPDKVYDRFHELLADAVPHDGVIVSSYHERDGLIRCEYAWSDGAKLDTTIFPALPFKPEGGGMQSNVIRTGEPALINDVRERVKGEGTYYDVDARGKLRKVPETGPTGTQAAVMVPIKHEGAVVGVAQLMRNSGTYTQYDLELVEGLVAQMAAAVRNARLYEEQLRLEAAEAAATAVAAEREHAGRVLDAVGDGIFLVDRDSTVRFWNRAAELITGFSSDDARGRNLSELFPAWPEVSADIPVAGAGESAHSVALPVTVKDVELWLSFVAVHSPAGDVYAFRDLTDERQLEEAKTDFIATVSHELRTPLTAVLGAAQTLLRRDVEFEPERHRQLLEIIAAQATRLSRVTDDVLLASSLDRGELRLKQAQLDIDEVVAETVEAMLPRLPEQTSLAVDATAVGTVLGDRDRVQQVLVNLIDNAVKYSPEGGEVVVTTASSEAGVRVEVADQGMGIPLSEQASVFEKFYRGDPQHRAVPGGTGLGLYICRELVRRMGGTIGVRSRPGEGSTFFFELPRA